MKIRLLLSAILAVFIFSASAQITTVGIIGSATPGGWDADTDMTQDAMDTAIWTINIDLVAGEAKFRANDDWAINWGDVAFPNGTGIQGGGNIPVFTGNYDITFNTVSGEYSFVVDSPIGIIGSSTPGGWDNDTNMFVDTNGIFFVTLDLVVGEAKFRKDDDWAVNWGSADFPTGTGTQGGDNILVSAAGTYFITLDTTTGAYNFEEQISFASVGIIGDATPSGWDMDTDLERSPEDPNQWSLFVDLVDGGAKFRADDAWTVDWGSADFPTGTGTQGGDNIPVTAGYYRVDFNSETGDYNFTEIGNYSTIGIIGDATPGGWDNDTDLMQDSIDPTIWTAALALTDGEAKFRADDDWAVNWGAGTFPMGIAEQEGANIPIEAGEYNITFNSLTGEYNFELFVVYDQVSLVGEASPAGAWPDTDDGGVNDTYLNIDETDNQMWSLAGVTLTDAGDGGGVKFRANTDWTVNWGAVDFPGGTGTQAGDNILSVAGTYDVSINTQTGDYLFADPSGTEEILNPADIKLYPNPASNMISIDLKALNVSGSAIVTIFDMQGRAMSTSQRQLSDNMTINVQDLNVGSYLLNISNGEFTLGKRFTVLK